MLRPWGLRQWRPVGRPPAGGGPGAGAGDRPRPRCSGSAPPAAATVRITRLVGAARGGGSGEGLGGAPVAAALVDHHCDGGGVVGVAGGGGDPGGPAGPVVSGWRGWRSRGWSRLGPSGVRPRRARRGPRRGPGRRRCPVGRGRPAGRRPPPARGSSGSAAAVSPASDPAAGVGWTAAGPGRPRTGSCPSWDALDHTGSPAGPRWAGSANRYPFVRPVDASFAGEPTPTAPNSSSNAAPAPARGQRGRGVDPFGEQHPGRGGVRGDGPAPFGLGELPVRRTPGHHPLSCGDVDGPGPGRHPQPVFGLELGAGLLRQAPVEPAVLDPGHHRPSETPPGIPVDRRSTRPNPARCARKVRPGPPPPTPDRTLTPGVPSTAATGQVSG